MFNSLLQSLFRRRVAASARVLLAALLTAGLGRDVLAAANAELCVMTYNLRYASDRPPNAWPDRRPLMAECILGIRPDLIGTQEGVYSQLKQLHSDLPDYEWIGLGRDGGSRGEFMAVFYRKQRFEPLEYDHFWLSDTPEVMGSTSWGNSNRRMVTWVRFRDRESGREFYFVNTHLDHEIQPAREKGAALIRDRVAALKPGLPVVLVGDFNAQAGGNPAYGVLVNAGGFADTWDVAGERRNAEYNTFNGFREARLEKSRIDWILVKGPAEVRATEIVTFSKNGQYPSDHFPVVAWMRLGQ